MNTAEKTQPHEQPYHSKLDWMKVRSNALSTESRFQADRPALVLCGLIAALLCLPCVLAGSSKSDDKEPDYTKGEKLKSVPWSLGSTGAYGFIWVKRGAWTRETRMILVDKTVEGTPAHGVLVPGDVIIGVVSPKTEMKATADSRFDSDARKSLSLAITAAETKASNGKLVLNIWRSGKTLPVALSLPVKGSFSATAPWNCDKTKVLIDGAAEAIVQRKFTWQHKAGASLRWRGNVDNSLDALGLLATGEAKYLPMVRDYVREMSKSSLALDVFTQAEGTSVSTWQGAYRNLMMTEYYLVTKDSEVLPGIKALSTYLALGQSGVGTWSHGMSMVEQNGLYGPACAYGAMNSASEVCAISLLLAQKCGIKTKEIDDAVERSLKFYRWYVDKGSIPYGDHTPRPDTHDSNGKNSMAAVLFDIAGDGEAAEYFVRMALASYNDRESGHSGPYFSLLWGPLGAARGGPEAAQSFSNHMRWHIEFERQSDGHYMHQEPLGKKYRYWSNSVSRLLELCLPRQSLYLTGKGGSSVKPIVGAELAAVTGAAEFETYKLSTKELLTSLSSWSPFVRYEAARELGKRTDDNVVNELIAMLNSPNRYAQYGACSGLKYAGRQSSEAVTKLVSTLQQDKDMNRRYFIVDALKFPSAKCAGEIDLAPAGKAATNELLKLAVINEPETDPRGKLHFEISELLFSGDGGGSKTIGIYALGKGSEQIDRGLLIPALKSFLINSNGGARTNAALLFDKLSDAELKNLWGEIYYMVKKPAPSNVMGTQWGQVLAVRAMAENHVKEGVELGGYFVFRYDGWGKGGRVSNGIPALKAYGQAMKDYFPDLEKRTSGGGKSRELKPLRDAYEFMKQTPSPELVSIEEAIKEYEKNHQVK